MGAIRGGEGGVGHPAQAKTSPDKPDAGTETPWQQPCDVTSTSCQKSGGGAGGGVRVDVGFDFGCILIFKTWVRQMSDLGFW